MSALLYGIVGLLVGIIVGDKVRSLASEHLNIDIPSLYASAYRAGAASAYPASVDMDYTASSMVGKSYERDYDNANELHLNHVTIE